jgi:hypothetical protein
VARYISSSDVTIFARSANNGIAQGDFARAVPFEEHLTGQFTLDVQVGIGRGGQTD